MAHLCPAATPADDPTRKPNNDPLTSLGASLCAASDLPLVAGTLTRLSGLGSEPECELSLTMGAVRSLLVTTHAKDRSGPERTQP